MSLQNLLKIGQLEEHETDAAQVSQMIESAGRNISDAMQESIYPATRLTASYRAITQLCTIALWANGFRLVTSKPGHHLTMIQSLVHTVGLDRDQMLLLDTFRVKRNAIDYTGEDVDEASVDECIGAATNLLGCVTEWLARNRPELAD